MPKPLKLSDVSQPSIVSRWNSIAEERDQQLRQGLDLSYREVLRPAIVNRSLLVKPKRCLDVGCGTGVLTEELARICPVVVGVDPSENSVRLARKNKPPNLPVEYIVADVSTLAESYSGDAFDLIVANMVLMDVIDLNQFVTGVRKLLKDGGVFLATITHPFFWPLYWGYFQEEWFKYDSEIAIESHFKISLAAQSEHTTVHFHRPLQAYSRILRKAGFCFTLAELTPDPTAEKSYPVPFEYPRFLIFECETLPISYPVQPW